MKSILIADHQPIAHLGVASLIEAEKLEILNGVTTGHDLFKALKQRTPDILILELDLPDLSGMNSIRKIKDVAKSTRILIFSRHPEEMYAISSLKAGAAGYVSKGSSLKLLKEAILQVGRGGIYIDRVISESLKDPKKNGAGSPYRKLSTREIEVFNLLSNGRKNKEIAEALAINQKTVSTYKTRLLRKLQVQSLAELINYSKIMNGSV